LGTRQNEERAGKCRANLGSVRAVTRPQAGDPAAAERAVNQSRNSHENSSRGHASGRARCVAHAPRWSQAIGNPQRSTKAFGQPFQGRPSIGGVPLLTGGGQRRDEAARLQELALEARGDRATLLRSGETEVQGGRGRQRRAVRYALALAPPNVVEESAGGIIRGREQGASPVLGRLRELSRHVRVSRPPAECPERSDRPLSVIEETVEIYRDKLGRLQRA